MDSVAMATKRKRDAGEDSQKTSKKKRKKKRKEAKDLDKGPTQAEVKNDDVQPGSKHAAAAASSGRSAIILPRPLQRARIGRVELSLGLPWPSPRSLRFWTSSKSYKVLFDPLLDTSTRAFELNSQGLVTRDPEYYLALIQQLRKHADPALANKRVKRAERGHEILLRYGGDVFQGNSNGMVIGEVDGIGVIEEEIVVRDPRKVEPGKSVIEWRQKKPGVKLNEFCYDKHHLDIFKVLITGIPPLTSTSLLKIHYRAFGDLTSFVWQLDPRTGAALGILHLGFSSIEAARKCVVAEDWREPTFGVVTPRFCVGFDGYEISSLRAVFDHNGVLLSRVLELIPVKVEEDRIERELQKAREQALEEKRKQMKEEEYLKMVKEMEEERLSKFYAEQEARRWRREERANNERLRKQKDEFDRAEQERIQAEEAVRRKKLREEEAEARKQRRKQEAEAMEFRRKRDEEAMRLKRRKEEEAKKQKRISTQRRPTLPPTLPEGGSTPLTVADVHEDMEDLTSPSPPPHRAASVCTCGGTLSATPAPLPSALEQTPIPDPLSDVLEPAGDSEPKDSESMGKEASLPLEANTEVTDVKEESRPCTCHLRRNMRVKDEESKAVVKLELKKEEDDKSRIKLEFDEDRDMKPFGPKKEEVVENLDLLTEEERRRYREHSPKPKNEESDDIVLMSFPNDADPAAARMYGNSPILVKDEDPEDTALSFPMEQDAVTSQRGGSNIPKEEDILEDFVVEFSMDSEESQTTDHQQYVSATPQKKENPTFSEHTSLTFIKAEEPDCMVLEFATADPLEFSTTEEEIRDHSSLTGLKQEDHPMEALEFTMEKEREARRRHITVKEETDDDVVEFSAEERRRYQEYPELFE